MNGGRNMARQFCSGWWLCGRITRHNEIMQSRIPDLDAAVLSALVHVDKEKRVRISTIPRELLLCRYGL
jgi:hypothetical protein